MIICTSIYAADLPKAFIMAETVKTYMPEVKVVACLIEREIPDAAKNQAYFDEVVLAKDLGFEDFEKFIFKYTEAEASDVVKGQLFTYLMNRFDKTDIFIFLDHDIQVFGPFDELLNVLDEHDIVVSPHSFEPEKQVEGITDNELWTLRNGVFDLGCLALKRSEKTLALIQWWKLRLDKFCYEDILEGVPMGTFTGQRWFCLVPGFFDVHIFKNAGYNFGPRNLSTRNVTLQDGKYMINGKPLRSCHFSDIESGVSDYMFNKYLSDLSNPAYMLRDAYLVQLEAMRQKITGDYKWTYSYYINGEKISKEARNIFRREPWRVDEAKSPFESNHEGANNNIQLTSIPADESMLADHNTFSKVVRHFKRYGLKKTFIKIFEKLMSNN